MKRIVFLIIASLLVLGLVLPGCTEPTPTEEVIYTFEDGKVVIGIAGEVGHATGDMQYLGATLAAGVINGAGGIVIDGVAHNITLQIIDTQEASDETGASGKAAMKAAIDDVDFVMGGFRTEALEVYRDVAMDAEKMFFNCGAATEALQHSVVDDYDTYKYWFKVTPYNEWLLGSSVLRMIGFSAVKIREALNMSADANLNAVIVAEDLVWSRDEQVPILEAGLPGLHVTNLHTYLVDSLDPAATTGAIADIVTYDPHIIIPIYSGTMGVYYAGTLLSYIGAGELGPMSVGINVMEQLKKPWAPGLNSIDPADGMFAAYHVFLDTWAEELAMTSTTLPFLAAFMFYASGEYPLYTASTYDACFILKACLEDVGYAEEGVGKAKADDIIEWWEDAGNSMEITTGHSGVFPQPGTTVDGEPALNEEQVKTIYDIDGYGYTYDENDWLMPPHTTHDIVYGPGLLTGVGCQWQWDGDAGQWKKFGVWPAEVSGADLTDQYGNWNFAYNGTKALIVPSWVTTHFGS